MLSLLSVINDIEKCLTADGFTIGIDLRGICML